MGEEEEGVGYEVEFNEWPKNTGFGVEKPQANESYLWLLVVVKGSNTMTMILAMNEPVNSQWKQKRALHLSNKQRPNKTIPGQDPEHKLYKRSH